MPAFSGQFQLHFKAYHARIFLETLTTAQSNVDFGCNRLELVERVNQLAERKNALANVEVTQPRELYNSELWQIFDHNKQARVSCELNVRDGHRHGRKVLVRGEYNVGANVRHGWQLARVLVSRGAGQIDQFRSNEGRHLSMSKWPLIDDVQIPKTHLSDLQHGGGRLGHALVQLFLCFRPNNACDTKDDARSPGNRAEGQIPADHLRHILRLHCEKLLVRPFSRRLFVAFRVEVLYRKPFEALDVQVGKLRIAHPLSDHPEFLLIAT
mmetsp:Transcript_34985/g.87086  ORF Transcript_34985/g.87086 Transcript_34985/m.87086 type:complete len:268 (-) Transcript_34985:26-829(-)